MRRACQVQIRLHSCHLSSAFKHHRKKWLRLFACRLLAKKSHVATPRRPSRCWNALTLPQVVMVTKLQLSWRHRGTIASAQRPKSAPSCHGTENVDKWTTTSGPRYVALAPPTGHHGDKSQTHPKPTDFKPSGTSG